MSRRSRKSQALAPAPTASTFASARPREKSISKLEEVATRFNSMDAFSFGTWLPNPDPVLKKLGQDQTVYEEIAGDSHLVSVISQRKAGVKRLKWTIERGNAPARQEKAYRQMVNGWNVPRISSEIVHGQMVGYQPMEGLWNEPLNGFAGIRDIIGKPSRWFRFDSENRARFLTKTNMSEGELIPPRHIVFAKRNPTYDNPYGEALLSSCYWPAFAKRNIIKWCLVFVEKYGMPMLVGKYPRNTTEAEQEKLLANLSSALHDCVMTMSTEDTVEILDPGGKTASSEVYLTMIAWANAEMSKAIVGHTGNSDSTPGKLGSEDAAQDVRADLIEEDKNLVEETINEVFRWVHEVNFSAGEPPKFVLYEEEDVDLDLATRDEKLVGILEKSGKKLSEKYLLTAYNLEDDDLEDADPEPEPAPVPPGQPPAPPGIPAEFAAANPKSYPDQTALDQSSTELAENGGVPLDFVAAIQQAFAETGDYDAAFSRAVELCESISQSELERMVSGALFASQAAGHAVAGEEA